MKLSFSPAWFCLAFACITVSFAAVPISSVSRGTSSSRYVPNQYIVEMASVQGLAGKRSYSSSPHEELYRNLRKRGIFFSVKKEYNLPNILIGALVQLSSSEDVAEITEIAGVQTIRPVIKVPPPKPVGQFTVSDPKDSRLPPDTLSTHRMTGVDKLHAEGLFGQGIKIGILDTGIDYTHPVLGGAYGPSNKIIGGHDFVGDAYTGSNTPVPDNDPLDQCAGHGTHVAGIIGANADNAFGINGVASEASIAAYRIFGCTGFTSDAVIVDALIRGYNDGMDILTLSLGGVDGWTEGTGSVVASRIAAQGRVVTIAAGNDGAFGSWYSSSPANGVDVISVASIDNIAIPVQNVTVKGVDYDPIPYLQVFPFNVSGDLPIYATSTDTTVTNDACDPLPDSTPDLSKFVVIVHRGTCAFTQKLDNIAAKGGKTFLIYNSDTGAFAGIAVGNYTAALISADDGKFLVNQFATKAPIRLYFPQVGGAFNLKDPQGGLVSSFSTYGPTYDMYFKPAVAAPGGNILSTIPVKLGSFAIASGTSMATPFTAGAAALVLQVKGKNANVGRSIRDLLQTTASSISSSNTDGSLLQTASQQGAGLIQVDRAAHTMTIVSPGQLTLNDTANFRGLQSFSVKNTGSKAITYSLSHVPAGTALSVQANSIFASVGPVPLVDAAATLTLSQSKITVLPGMTAEILAAFSPPNGVDASTYPVYSGFIDIVSPTETVKVTYLGVAASLRDKAILDNTDTFFGVKLPTILDASGNPQVNETDYTFQGTDVPALVYRLAFGSPTIRIDLVKEDFTLNSSYVKRSWFSWWWTQGRLGDSAFAQVKTLGPLAEFDYIPRNSADPEAANNGYNVYTFDGKFANKTKIENGKYRVLMRAMKVTGNPRREKDYENWLSPVFGIAAP